MRPLFAGRTPGQTKFQIVRIATCNSDSGMVVLQGCTFRTLGNHLALGARWPREGQVLAAAENMATLNDADIPMRHGRQQAGGGLTRRLFVATMGASLAAPAILGGAPAHAASGHIRRLRMLCGQTDENIDVIYWIDGEYIPEAMSEINQFMRDWREDKAIVMNRENIDILAATHRILDTDEPFSLLSGYRTKKTNLMLRRRSRQVARNSLHVIGYAADVRLQSRSAHKIAKAATSCRNGGVGKYSGSNFVHIDCGDVRTWGA